MQQSIHRGYTVNPMPGSFSRMQNSSSGGGISSQAGSSASLISWSTPSCQTPRGCCSPPASSTLPTPAASRIGNVLWLSLGKKNTSVGLRNDSYFVKKKVVNNLTTKKDSLNWLWLHLWPKILMEQWGDLFHAWLRPSYRWLEPPFLG